MTAHLATCLSAFSLIVASGCGIASGVDRAVLADGSVEVILHEPGGVSAYILDLGDGTVALIDSGSEEGAAPLVAALEDRQLGPEDVVAIFLTHGHGDHTSGVSTFPDAQIYALEAELALIAGEVNPTRPLPSFGEPELTGIEVTDILTDGDRIAVGEKEVIVFAVPGHTSGSAAFVFGDTLFLGDAATATSSGTLDNATWIFSENTDENLESLARLVERLDDEAIDVEAIAPSHSAALAGGLGPLRELTAPRN
jgi:glyoxylase-like metal-dependent hydrolase (beta-lactamase superfamily II)